MKHAHRWKTVAGLLLVAALALGVSACTRAEASGGREVGSAEPTVRLEPVAGSEVSRVILSQRAAERLGIKTVPAFEHRTGARTNIVIPYAALLYDENGRTWTFTNPAPGTFVRQPVTVDRIFGDLALLSDGPPEGVMVVTVGAAELLGAELGVGE